MNTSKNTLLPSKKAEEVKKVEESEAAIQAAKEFTASTEMAMLVLLEEQEKLGSLVRAANQLPPQEEYAQRALEIMQEYEVYQAELRGLNGKDYELPDNFGESINSYMNAMRAWEEGITQATSPSVSLNPAELMAELHATKITVTIGDITEMHRKLGFCMRGNQRPAVLAVQQDLVKLLPKDTPIIYGS